jgi:hypothetical protein
LVTALIGFLYNRNYRQKKRLLQANTLLQQQRIAELEKERQLLAARGVLQGQVDERTRLAKICTMGWAAFCPAPNIPFRI